VSDHLPHDLDAPSWDDGGHVHNWKNYISEELRGMWGSFTREQKAAIYRSADETASNENWD
jgi:hypothetical protein